MASKPQRYDRAMSPEQVVTVVSPEEDAAPIDPPASRYCLIPDARLAAVRSRLVGWLR